MTEKRRLPTDEVANPAASNTWPANLVANLLAMRGAKTIGIAKGVIKTPAANDGYPQAF
jgi:hypothetical protein